MIIAAIKMKNNGDKMIKSSDLNSSFLSKADYNPSEEKLTVFFRKGSKFSYYNVSNDVYEEFIKAEKPSDYFNSKIKNGFSITK